METAPDYYYQDVVMELAFRLCSFAFSNNLGKVIISPIDIYLDNGNVFQPDIIFIAADRLDGLLKNGKIHGAPDLVVEVLSPGTQNKDRVKKKAVYEKHGVKEYWLVQPRTKKVQGFTLRGGKYVAFPEETDSINSPFLNLAICF